MPDPAPPWDASACSCRSSLPLDWDGAGRVGHHREGKPLERRPGIARRFEPVADVVAEGGDADPDRLGGVGKAD